MNGEKQEMDRGEAGGVGKEFETHKVFFRGVQEHSRHQDLGSTAKLDV